MTDLIMEELLYNVKHINFPSMHYSKDLTDEEKRIREEEVQFEVQLESVKGNCMNCGHDMLHHDHDRSKVHGLYVEYYRNSYKCKGDCNCRKFEGKLKTVKLCENGELVL